MNDAARPYAPRSNQCIRSPARCASTGPLVRPPVAVLFSQALYTGCTSLTLITSSDGYGNTKSGTLKTSLRRIGCHRLCRARINNCDRERHRKPINYGEISLNRVERPRAGSRGLGTRLSELSFRKHRLAVVLAYPSDFLATSHRCGEGSRIHGSIEVERLYRE